MIDMEDDIFDEVSEKVYAAFEKKCPDLLIMSEYVKSPSYNNNYGLRRGSQPRLFPSQSRSC